MGSGINRAELARLWHRLQPLAVSQMPLEVPPPRSNRFGSPLVLSRLHWVRPELVAEVKFLTWTDDNLLRQVVYEGLREDKQASEICRPVPHLETRGDKQHGHSPEATAPLTFPSVTGSRNDPPPGLWHWRDRQLPANGECPPTG